MTMASRTPAGTGALWAAGLMAGRPGSCRFTLPGAGACWHLAEEGGCRCPQGFGGCGRVLSVRARGRLSLQESVYRSAGSPRGPVRWAVSPSKDSCAGWPGPSESQCVDGRSLRGSVCRWLLLPRVRVRGGVLHSDLVWGLRQEPPLGLQGWSQWSQSPWNKPLDGIFSFI
jgi:hypothetical protein